MSPIASSLTPATQSGILEILQREQDHAVALLSSSPLLASLFVSYANQASAFESATPSTESEDWKALEDTISKLQEEINALKPENLEMKGKLEAAAASQEAFRSQVSALKEMNTAQQGDIKSLRAELLEAKGECDRLSVERDALRDRVMGLEVCFGLHPVMSLMWRPTRVICVGAARGAEGNGCRAAD
jgi:FtsZ-binding cell division protein ZapB